MKTLSESERSLLNTAIREIPDFPEPGIVFRDITTLLNNAEAFSVLMNHLRERYQESDLDFIAGIDARGFIFGAALAQMLNVGFVPVRKKGKLPYTTVSEKYVLEYGVDEVEIHIDAFRNVEQPRVLLVDDLIATGGTAYAATNLIRQSGGECVEACFVMSLDDLGGKEKLEEITSVYHLL
jgi:adenine phosphoribosyltransferase